MSGYHRIGTGYCAIHLHNATRARANGIQIQFAAGGDTNVAAALHEYCSSGIYV